MWRFGEESVGASLRKLLGFEVKHAVGIDVDDLGVVVLRLCDLIAAIEMNMAVEQIARLEPAHEGKKTPKTSVGTVRLVVNPQRG